VESNEGTAILSRRTCNSQGAKRGPSLTHERNWVPQPCDGWQPLTTCRPSARSLYEESKGVLLNMKLYIFPPSTRALGIVTLKNYLALDCEVQPIDLGRGDQLTPQYTALNPNRKMPTLEDDGFVLWESNAILFYMGAKNPNSGLWPSDPRCQADVLRWLAWESAHWDAESWGMVAFEKASKAVLGLGALDRAFIARGEQNFVRFAAVLDDQLKGRAWLSGERLTIADFSIGATRADRCALAATPRALFRNRSLVRRLGSAARMAGCSRCQGRGHGCLVCERKCLAMTHETLPYEVIRLWPEGPPSKLEGVGPEVEFRGPVGTGGDAAMLRNVSEPTLSVFRPAKPNGVAVIVCPGGGWRILAWEHEGIDVAKWLTACTGRPRRRRTMTPGR
jgi:glutathione S-transferase